MAVLTPLSSADVRMLLSRYEVGELEQHWPAPEGIENTNYFLRARGEHGPREFVLTVLEQNASPEDVLLPVLRAAARHGLPVAMPLDDRHGRAAVRLGSKPALLSPRLPGSHPEAPGPGECSAIGRFLARFHLATLDLRHDLPAHPRNGAWLEAHLQARAGRLSWSNRLLLADAVKATREMLARSDVGRLPQGVVHGDLFRDNALFSAGTLSGVLDFHHAARAALTFDLAVVANDWCMRDGELDPEALMALLRGYDAVRHLGSNEVWFLPAFMLFAAAAFWLSRLDVEARATAETPCKDPEEMACLTARHWHHQIMIDERLFKRR